MSDRKQNIAPVVTPAPPGSDPGQADAARPSSRSFWMRWPGTSGGRT